MAKHCLSRQFNCLALALASLFSLLPVLSSAQPSDQHLCDHSVTEDPGLSIPACTRLLEHADQAATPSLYNNRGIAKLINRDFEEAKQDFSSALDRNPNLAEAFKNRGLAHYERDEFEKAIDDFNKAIKLNPKSPDFYNARGVALLSEEEFEPAIEDFDEAIKLKPQFSKAYLNRGRTYTFARAYPQHLDHAIDDFVKFIALSPNDPIGYVNRAAALLDKGKFPDAIKDYDQALRLDPHNARIYAWRGEAKRLQGDLSGAFADHDRSIRIEPNEDAYNNRALAFRDKGEFAKAIADCNKAILLNSNAYIPHTTRSLIKRLSGDLGGSFADADKAVGLKGKDPLGLTFHGETLRELRNFDGAMNDFNKAIQSHPEFVAAYTGRGLTNWRKGDLAAAKADLETALTLSPDLDAGLARPAQKVARENLPKVLAEIASRSPAPEPGAPAGVRMALVIGNSAYPIKGWELRNPKQDANAVAATLRTIGFKRVETALDVSREGFYDVLDKFFEDAKQADWAVIYYAGHGVQLDDQNYLIPIETKIKDERSVKSNSVPLDYIMTEINKLRQATLRLVIIDACRDNFGKAVPAANTGLAEPKAPDGTVVIYSARGGKTAKDGDPSSKHSPFTQAFLDNVVTPGQTIDRLYGKIHEDVRSMTAGAGDEIQNTAIYNQWPRQDLYFVKR